MVWGDADKAQGKEHEKNHEVKGVRLIIYREEPFMCT